MIKSSGIRSYSREEIKKTADTINSARSAICTTFAITGADLLLDLNQTDDFKDDIKRIEIVARQAGQSGTHCFVVLNRTENSDLQDPETWGEDALVVDPWLASLQNPGIYNIPEYQMAGWIPAKLEVNFDTSTPNLAQIKKQQEKLEFKLRMDCKKMIERGDVSQLREFIKQNNINILEYRVEKGVDMMTYALNHNQDNLFNELYSKVNNPSEDLRFQILKHAIRQNNLSIFSRFKEDYEIFLQQDESKSLTLLNEAYQQIYENGKLTYFYELFDIFVSQHPNISDKAQSNIKDFLIDIHIKDIFPVGIFLNIMPSNMIFDILKNLESEAQIYGKLINKLTTIDVKYKLKNQQPEPEKTQNHSPPTSPTPIAPTPIAPSSSGLPAAPPPPPSMDKIGEFLKRKTKPPEIPISERKRREKRKIIDKVNLKNASIGVKVGSGKKYNIKDKQRNVLDTAKALKTYLNHKNKENSISSILPLHLFTFFGDHNKTASHQNKMFTHDVMIKKLHELDMKIIETQNLVFGIGVDEQGQDIEDYSIEQLEGLESVLDVYQSNLNLYQETLNAFYKSPDKRAPEVEQVIGKFKNSVRINHQVINDMKDEVSEQKERLNNRFNTP